MLNNGIPVSTSLPPTLQRENVVHKNKLYKVKVLRLS